MVPVLFYLPGACSFGSIAALEWLGAPFRLCRLTHEESKSEAFKKLNPLGLVPTFKSGEGVLTESAAVLQHIGFLGLSKKIAYRQGTHDFDYLNQVMSFLTTTLHPAIGLTIHPERYSDVESAQTEITEKAMIETVPEKLLFIEEILSRHTWLAGTHPTIADAYFYGIGRGAKKFVDLDKDFPKIAAFYTRFQTDHGIQFAQAIEDGKPAKSTGGFKGEVPLSQLV